MQRLQSKSADEKISAVDTTFTVSNITDKTSIHQVVISLSAEQFGAWGETAFAPEASFMKIVESIPGLTVIETQTYTLMTL